MLDIDLWTVLWTGINLVILYLLMRHFLFKPVTAVMEQRAQAIQEGLDQAEKARQAMEEIQSEKESQLAKARSQADQIVGQARAQGQQEYARILSSASLTPGRFGRARRARSRPSGARWFRIPVSRWPLWPCWQPPVCPARCWMRTATGPWWRIF